MDNLDSVEKDLKAKVEALEELRSSNDDNYTKLARMAQMFESVEVKNAINELITELREMEETARQAVRAAPGKIDWEFYRQTIRDPKAVYFLQSVYMNLFGPNPPVEQLNLDTPAIQAAMDDYKVAVENAQASLHETQKSVQAVFDNQADMMKKLIILVEDRQAMEAYLSHTTVEEILKERPDLKQKLDESIREDGPFTMIPEKQVDLKRIPKELMPHNV